MRKIAIITSTRADWGLLSPIAHSLSKKAAQIKLSVVATNMHLDPQRGMTINEIQSEGFEPTACIPLKAANDTPEALAQATGYHMAEIAKALAEIAPDIIVILGDRFEMLAVATAATIMRIPIAHISGGEISQGAIDDNIRHAISKLSSLHFATTETHRNRLIAMGEQPENVFNTGALGVWNMVNASVMTRSELEQDLNIDLDKPFVLVTYHPATNDTVPAKQRFSELLRALEQFPQLHILFTYPNNDADSADIITQINQFVVLNRGRTYAIPSLGALRYRSMLHHVIAVIGNSSSGIVEVPSAHIPTINIGIRQKGRTAADSVIHCGDTASEISKAIEYAISQEGQDVAKKSANPYFKPNTVEIISETLVSCDISTLLPKKFYDICTANR